MKKIIIILMAVAGFQSSFAQNTKDKVKQDTIKVSCPDMPREKRPRLTVPRFTVTAPSAPQDQFGDNLTTMLTNALQQVNCYNVLTSLKDKSDLTDEQDFQQSGNVNKATAVKKGKMLGANVIVTGEVITYEATSKDFGLLGVHTVKATATVGINITLSNPETRETIDSRIFKVTKKTEGGMRVGTYIPYLGPVNAVSSAMSNPAVQSAVQDAIDQAVEYIAGERDKIPMPAESAVPDNATQTTITFQNIKYEQLADITSSIEKIQGVYDVTPGDFDSNGAAVVINHSLKPMDLISKIIKANPSLGLSVKAASQTAGTAILAAKQ